MLQIFVLDTQRLYILKSLYCLSSVTTDILGQEGKNVVYYNQRTLELDVVWGTGYRCAESNYWQISEYHMIVPSAND